MAQPPVWKTAHELETSSLRSSRFAMLHQRDDDSLFVDGRLSSSDTYVIAFKSPVRRLTAVRIESLTDPDRYEQGPGQGADQHAVLTGISIQTGASDKSLPAAKAEIASAEADCCQPGFAAADAIVCRETTGWSLVRIGVPHVAVFVLRQPAETAADGRIIVRLEHYAGRGNNMNRFRISVTDGDPNQFAVPPVPDEISDLVNRSPSARSADEQAALKRNYQSVSQSQGPDLAAWKLEQAKFAKLCSTYAAQTVRNCTTPRETLVHLYGDFRRPGEKVEPGLLPALSKSAPTDRRLTRLDLAL